MKRGCLAENRPFRADVVGHERASDKPGCKLVPDLRKRWRDGELVTDKGMASGRETVEGPFGRNA